MKIYGPPEENVRQAVISGDITVAVYGLGRIWGSLAAVFADAGARMLFLSVTYRDYVNETRFSPAIDLISELKRRGAEVFAYDPAPEGEVQRFGAIPSDLVSGEGINGIDTILIASGHAGFKEIDWNLLDRRMRHKVVVDGGGILAPEERRLRRYLYRAVGLS